MIYPRFVFKDGGPIERAYGTYAHELVNDEAEHKAALGAGWYDNIQDAIDGVAHVVPVEPKKPEPVEMDAPPTREEMEAKAESLGIKFDGRIGDKKLLALIEKALEG